MKILFYHPTSNSDGYPEPPLGLGYLMFIAKEAGCQYELYDEDHHLQFLSIDDLVLEFKPDLFVISFMTPQYYEATKVIKKFKKLIPNSKIIVGGSHPSSLPEETLKENKAIDFLCKGEGEKTFKEFLNYLNGKMPLEEINGLFYMRDGEVFSNPQRKLLTIKELNQYSVDWDKIMEYGPYMQKLFYTKTIESTLAVITARGCPFECTFCDEVTIWRRKVRMRSMDAVISEVTYLRDKYNVHHYNILDDTFTLSKLRVREFCEKIAPLNVKFRITAKVTTVNKEMLSQLKEAGCMMVAYGVESGDQDVLDKMKKKQTIQDIKTAFELTKNANLPSYALCMVGNLGENMNSVKKTVKLIREIKPDYFSGAIMTPYPGTDNYRICKNNGWIQHYEWKHWVPSLLKTKNYKLVTRTDKMDENEILKAYYFMNRYVLISRFKQKYGTLFLFNIFFYIYEVFPRLKTIGFKSFFRYLINLFIGI